MEGRFDDMFFMIASELGSIDRILYEFLGFLKRRTDFFVLANPGDKAGFPPGVAERMIFSVYKKFRDEYDKEHPFVPKSPEEPKPVEKVLELPAEEPKEEAKEEPHVDKPEDTEISTYNGAKTDKYSWSQDLNDVTIQITLPPGTRSRDLEVKLQRDSLSVALKTDLSNPLMRGKLFEIVHKDNSYWQIDSGSLVISLDKAKDSVWKTVLVGDSEIDPKTVDTSRRVDEYDDETQQGIRKVMHEHDRKLKGLPSTDEEIAQDKLKEMWRNSKLGDQPFDMSRLGEILTYKPQDEKKPPEQ